MGLLIQHMVVVPFAHLATMMPLRCMLLSVKFAGFALWTRAVTPTGAAAGTLICLVLCMGDGFSALATLIAVFLLAWSSTKVGARRKEKLGTAEKSDGRNASQIFANLGVAAVFAAMCAFWKNPRFLLGLAASLAEAGADTVSSEIGQLSESSPRLITTWEIVSPGTDGGVTLLGTFSGVIAAIAVSVVAAASGLVAWNRIEIPIFAGTCGMIADSLLGAVLERRNLLNNDTVNFIGTLIAALIAFSI